MIWKEKKSADLLKNSSEEQNLTRLMCRVVVVAVVVVIVVVAVVVVVEMDELCKGWKNSITRISVEKFFFLVRQTSQGVERRRQKPTIWRKTESDQV